MSGRLTEVIFHTESLCLMCGAAGSFSELDIVSRVHSLYLYDLHGELM